MSDIISAKVKLKNEAFSKETTSFLFNIIRNACERQIAIKVYQKVIDIENIVFSQVEIEKSEVLLSFTDSYNRELTCPLIGSNRDFEVKEFRPEPLKDRLVNLQGLFEFIFKQKNVLQIDLLLTSDDLRFDEEMLAVELSDFATYLEPLIEYAKFPSFHYQFCWTKYKSWDKC